MTHAHQGGVQRHVSAFAIEHKYLLHVSVPYLSAISLYVQYDK